MITLDQVIRGILTPAIVAALLAWLGRWLRWRWVMPLGAGVAFILGYGLLGATSAEKIAFWQLPGRLVQFPGLPPQDGPDWLFWMAIPATLLAVMDAVFQPKLGWILGAAAGAMAWVIVRPVVPGGVSLGALCVCAIAVGLAGAGLCYIARAVEPRIGAWAVAGGWCIAVGGAAVVVLACDSASIGVRGLAAAAALASVAAFSRRDAATGRSIAILAVAVLAGILAGGRFYAGVSWAQFAVLMASPALLAAAWIIPARRRRWATVIALLAVMALVFAVVAPAALAAKNASESNSADPY